MKSRSFYFDAPQYCHYYFDLVEEENLEFELQKSKKSTLNLFESIPTTLENYAYVENKWSIKQVLRHLIDCERVYAYRAFRLSRFDQTELSTFDENEYINRIDLKETTIADLLREYSYVRDSSIELFKNMTEPMQNSKGNIGGNLFSVKAIGMMTVGHNIHHNNIVVARYL